MIFLREHIIFKILTLTLVLSLFVPSIVKFTHIFTHAHHKHEVCSGKKTTHLHELDSDCDFYSFKLNNNFTVSFSSIDLFSRKKKKKEIVPQYQFLSKFQHLHFSLRGPPSLI